MRSARRRGDTRSVQVESEFLCKDGSIKAINSQTTTTDELYIVICEDITKAKMLAKKDKEEFSKDPITGCYTLKTIDFPASSHR